MTLPRTAVFVAAVALAPWSVGCERPWSPMSPTPTPTSSGQTEASGPTGTYALTITASPSCATVPEVTTGERLPLPDSVMVRRYVAAFHDGTASFAATDGTGDRVGVGGVDHYFYNGVPLMTLNGAELRIIVPPKDVAGSPECTGGDYWWEELSATAQGREAFELCGLWVGTVAESGNIEGTINGAFAYYKGNRPNAGPHWDIDLFCPADDHRFRLVKQ